MKDMSEDDSTTVSNILSSVTEKAAGALVQTSAKMGGDHIVLIAGGVIPE